MILIDMNHRMLKKIHKQKIWFNVMLGDINTIISLKDSIQKEILEGEHLASS